MINWKAFPYALAFVFGVPALIVAITVGLSYLNDHFGGWALVGAIALAGGIGLALFLSTEN